MLQTTGSLASLLGISRHAVLRLARKAGITTRAGRTLIYDQQAIEAIERVRATPRVRRNGGAA